MLVSDVSIRRYTPPTCTLEIWGKRSLLSRWTGSPPLKEWRFELRFDDPRLPEEEQVTVGGDRAQLQLLCDVVRTYVQNLLHQSFALTCPVPSPATGISLLPAAELTLSSSVVLLERPSSPSDTSTPDVQPKAGLPSGVEDSAPALTPKGLVAHELSLGSLSAGVSQPLVKLSASQLFDLATALEDYSAEANNLTARPPFSKGKAMLVAASAAAALLLTAGIAAQLRSRLSPTNQPEGPVANQQESQLPKISEVLPPVPLPPQPVPSPTLPPSLAQQKALPPPLGVKVSPNVPRVLLPEPNPLPPPPTRPSDRQVIAIKPEANRSSPSSAPFGASQGATSPNLPPAPPLAARRLAPEPAFEGTNLPNAAQPEGLATNSEPPLLLDTIPQVAEVRHYFQERWQVPKKLNQRLEYRLLLNREGSLERIIPLGRAAQIYLDRTGMPLLGEPFVSPLTSEETATIRLVLVPDGNVKTFLE